MANITEVVAALIWDGHRFLICQRPAHKARGLLWEFVGGKTEAGETSQQALIRECQEELGITLNVGEIFMDVTHEYPDLTVHLTLFNATIAHGTPQLLEHNAMAWIGISEIENYDFCPADVEILAQIQAKAPRCQWPNLLTSPLYMEYHDHEWGVASHDDGYLFEMLVLESFHCGLSWLLMLKKREGFRTAFDGFDPHKIANYDDAKVAELMDNPQIVRNKAKILATIQNAKSYLQVVEEFGSFDRYIWSFTDGQTVRHPFDGVTNRNHLSDRVSKDMKRRGFKFMGTVTTFSYLEAIGVMNNHAEDCFCCESACN
ncbi:DNA-3-methyladenine glycosylase I [Bengtsoniella intestinalis]|uniref:DNA-3-methyladenine glycosylase I n=1 Tax=Bengtsoniella intestinalis TaxID=3073143 RepID=UPI00391FC39D